jgi:aryl-alcohol dehydrogenase-like predicted oxidoreductase
MLLALGTVQFGVPYGLARNDPLLPDSEIRKILEFAKSRGIYLLDTAPAYGDIEERLGELCDGLDFEVNSKIGAIPAELNDVAAANWALESAHASHGRLGGKLRSLLFHRAEDLIGARGEVIWRTVARWATSENIELGASAYDDGILKQAHSERQLGIAQFPGNAFDQRIVNLKSQQTPSPTLHLRSAFLQGMLLLPCAQAISLMPNQRRAFERWHQWLANHAFDPLHGAISIVKAFTNVSACVVGVDSLRHLEGIAEVFRTAEPVPAEELASADANLIDPRLWSAAL